MPHHLFIYSIFFSRLQLDQTQTIVCVFTFLRWVSHFFLLLQKHFFVYEYCFFFIGLSYSNKPWHWISASFAPVTGRRRKKTEENFISDKNIALFASMYIEFVWLRNCNKKNILYGKRKTLNQNNVHNMKWLSLSRLMNSFDFICNKCSSLYFINSFSFIYYLFLYLLSTTSLELIYFSV